MLGVRNDTENRFEGKRSWEFDVDSQGWRYHMSNIMASLGSSQLKKFKKFAKKRRELCKLYDYLLGNIDGIKIFKRNYDEIVPHIYPILILNSSRDKLREFLQENNIQTGIHYKPNHMLTLYKDCSKDSLKRCEDIYYKLLSLPLHPDLSYRDVKTVVFFIKKFILQ